MANLQDRNSHNHEVPPNQDGKVPNYGNNANLDPAKLLLYRESYVDGRSAKRHLQEDGQESRDNNSATRGFLIGVVLTSLVGLALMGLHLFDQKPQKAHTSVVAPVPSALPSSEASPRTISPGQ